MTIPDWRAERDPVSPLEIAEPRVRMGTAALGALISGNPQHAHARRQMLRRFAEPFRDIAQSPAVDDDDVRAQRRTFLPVQTNAQTIAIRSPEGSGRSTDLLPRLRVGDQPLDAHLAVWSLGSQRPRHIQLAERAASARQRPGPAIRMGRLLGVGRLGRVDIVYTALCRL